jgi:hypothetical protein
MFYKKHFSYFILSRTISISKVLTALPHQDTNCSYTLVHRVLTGVLRESKGVETEAESCSVVCLELLRGSILPISHLPCCWSLVVHEGSLTFVAKMLASDLPLHLLMSPGTT